MATAEAPVKERKVEEELADDGSNQAGSARSSPPSASKQRQPEVVVVDAGDEPITMPSLCMNCYENVRRGNWK
jgi:hypothetical protein